MKIFWKHSFPCLLIVLVLGGNAAVKSFSFDKDKFPQDVDLSREDDRFIDYRLPTSVKPIKYDIQLQQNSWNDDNFTFRGYINIQTKIINATNNITLHVGKLEIINSMVNTSRNVTIIDEKYDSVTEKYTFVLSDTLKPEANVELYFEYSGVLADNMIGFYRSSYTDEDEQIKWLAATQFQTTHARHAFPCFDEPSFKATFTISILRYPNYTSLSNMPRTNSTNKFSSNLDEDMVLDTYENSVPMSTYLVAFIISQFRSLSTNDGRFRVWTRPAVIEQAQYALKIGPAALKLLEDLFKQEYILPKMDMVAMPDFAAGAMENWGLATYRETRMLYDEKESSVLAQQSVASVIVHEMTHMWFGNLVTPEWWGYLWLSEGFARFFQYFATAQIEKDWNMREQFVVAQHQAALMTDSVKSSRPLTRNVSTAAQIATAGDSITYAKGASIIRMMAFTFGEDLFGLALQDYLLSNKDRGLANPDDLWRAIENRINNKSLALEIPAKVKIIMDSWTLQAGYPVVSVSIDDTKIHVTQERFLSTNLSDETPINATWWVPLSWTTQNDLNFDDMSAKYWLSSKKHVIDLKVDPGNWVMFNIQSSGFYRVKYDSITWMKIFQTLNSNEFSKIHVLNRASIVDDLLNLARAGFESYRIALNGLDYLKWETNYLPFKAALNGLDYVNGRFTGMEGHFLLKEHILSLIDDRRKQLGYEDRAKDDRLTVLLRQELNSWACKLGDKECTTTYVNKFKKWRANASFPIHPNERATAYCTAIRNGTSEDWEFLWNKYFHSNHADDQLVMLNALACSLNTTVLEKYLLYVISGYENTRIRRQDSTSVFAAVYGSSLIGAECVLDFVEKHHEQMEKYWGGQDTIATILNGASQHFSTFRLVDKFQEFCERHKTKLAAIIESLTASLTTARRELNWYLSASRSIVPLLHAYMETSMHDVVPRKYFIRLKPNLTTGNFTMHGNVTIEADVVRETKRIVLHSRGIQHHDVSIKANEMDVKIERWTKIEQDDYYVIDVSESLPVNTKLTIDVEYTSHLNASELRSFYKGSYANGNEKRWFAATHLEPIGARNMFPCFDLPSAKAFFTLQVDVPPGYYPISNMKWWKQEKLDDGMRYTFFQTPNMSTYLLGLIVSDLKSVELSVEESASLPALSIYARANAISQTEYAASVISPLLNFFEEMLEKYQLSKLDMIALPDLPSTAGDDWGIVTYRETNLLYDATHSPFTSMQTIRNTIAREIAHQWFGNLVTPANWTDLWLKRGFGGYLEYYAPAHVFNDTTLEPQFVVDQVHSALRADGSRSTRALSPDKLPSDIRSMYDVITYAKGASVLRMMDKSFGSSVFRGTLKDYIHDNPYNVVTSEALYYALEAQAKKAGLRDNVTDMLARWTTQPGYPVLHVNVKEDVATLEQKRFLLETDDEESVTDSLWHIPITWASVDNYSEYLNTTPSFWMTTKQETFRPPSSLFTLNTQQAGYYRVNYDTQHWGDLIEHLKNDNFSEIHEINRAALIDDLMNLARANYVSYELAIRATMYLRHEDHYLPWRAFYDNLPYLNHRFRGRGIENLYKVYVRSIVTPLYERLGFRDRPNDDYLTKLLRMHTRKWACELDTADCTSEATSYFSEKHPFKMVPADYRDVVYCTAMRTDTTTNTYDILWKKYSDSNVATDKLVILGSLACSRNKKILEELLREAIKEDSSIRFHDSERVFLDIADASLNGTETVMSVIGDYYDDVRRHFGDYWIKNILNVLASRLSTYDLYKQYQSLLDQLVKKDLAFDKMSLLRQAKFELDWYDKMVPEIFEVLDELFSSNEYRLPRTLYPEYYNIKLIPHMEKGTFDGLVQIYMRVEEETTIVVVNSHNLNYNSINVYKNYKMGHNPDSRKIPLRNYKEYHELQQLRIYLTEPMQKTIYFMAQIKFTGILGDDMKGFYRSSYVDGNGMRHWLATTQFEPTYARRAFPCFDEPAFKSNFIINVKRPNHYTTLSNMPIFSNLTEKGNYTWDRFEINKIPMSTYLIAFVVSEFERVNESEPFLNVWGRPEIAMYGQFAQDTGKLLIDAFVNFTEIDYQLPKLDLVGIPDFDMGAMENWGLATFREHGLFYDEKEIAASQEKHIIAIIAHELAHMWFGNLVTCEWWEYLWLNEGFAEYFEWFASDMILPDYKFMDQFVVYELHPALLKDSVSASVRPMTSPVKSPEEISSIFDYVNYGKAASVLRMIFNTLEPTVHASAIQSYLADQSNGTTRPEDLWRSFDQHATIEIDYKKVSFAQVMDTWTNQPGYPVVNAVLNNDRLILTQKRFLLNEWTLPSKKRDSHAEQFYWIPYDIVTFPEPYTRLQLKRKGWLGREPRIVYINPTSLWFIVNRQQTGFYRVNYDAASWQQLIDILMDRNRFHSIHVLNRAQIVDDLFNLARATHVEYALLLNATRYLAHETHHVPWRAFFNGLSYIHERLERQDEVQGNLTKYVQNLMSDAYDRIEFDTRDEDEHLDRLNREMFLQWACKLNETNCTQNAMDLFADWRANASKRVSPDARAAVYCTAIRIGTADDWQFLWQWYLQTNFASERNIIIKALGCSMNEEILQDYLWTAVKEYDSTNATFRKQDIPSVFSSVYSASQLGVNVVLDFLIDNVDNITDSFRSEDMVESLFHNVASHISHEHQYHKLKKFIVSRDKKMNYPNMKMNLISAIRTAKINLMWYNRNRDPIENWIEKWSLEQEKSNNRSTVERFNAHLIIITIIVAIAPYLF